MVLHKYTIHSSFLMCHFPFVLMMCQNTKREVTDFDESSDTSLSLIWHFS